MLGLGHRRSPWRWKAVGKHPAAADYINVLDGSALMDAIGDWMTKGYGSLTDKGDPNQETHSWRFWFRGAQRGHLICGVGRDSSDRIGRPYPLLVLGEGPLKGWEAVWTRLPIVLARTWSQIEQVAARRYADLNEFGEAVRQLPAPSIEADATGGPVPQADTVPESMVAEHCRKLHRDGRVIIPLTEDGEAAPGAAAGYWQTQLSAQLPEPPLAVFWGGNPRHSYLALIQKTLATTDFIQLWRV